MSRTAIPNEETVAPARRPPDDVDAPAGRPPDDLDAPARRPRVGALSSSALRHESDDRLVALTRAGSERAFAEIMRRYQRQLQVYCVQLLGAGRAEDAVQQSFLQAFIALRDRAPREIVLRPWLYRIARNCSIDLLRKPGSDHDQLDLEFDGMPQPPGVLEQKEELAKLVEAILALPEGQRRALTLRELEGRSYGEISAELGHTSSGVRQLIFRARTALRNVAGFAFPVGSFRWQLLGHSGPGPSDPQQLATVAGVSAPVGAGALQAVGSILAATVTLAAGGSAAAAQASGDRPVQVQGIAASAWLLPPTQSHLFTAQRARQAEGRHGTGSGGAGVPGGSPFGPAADPTVVPSVAQAQLIAASGADLSPTGTPGSAAQPDSAEPPATEPALGSGTSPDEAAAPTQRLSASATSDSTADPSAAAAPHAAAGKRPPATVPAPGTTGSGPPKVASGVGAPPQPAKGTPAPVKSVKPVKPPVVKPPKAPAIPKAPATPSSSAPAWST